jgi:hypothetical protein
VRNSPGKGVGDLRTNVESEKAFFRVEQLQIDFA